MYYVLYYVPQCVFEFLFVVGLCRSSIPLVQASRSGKPVSPLGAKGARESNVGS